MKRIFEIIRMCLLIAAAGLLLLSIAHGGEQLRQGTVLATNFPTLQAALDAVGKRGGGEVFIPAGVYEIPHTLKVPSTVTLRGAGAATVLKATEAIGENTFPNNRVIQNADPDQGNTGIVIRDLAVDGGFLGEYHQTGIYGISLNNSDNCRIEDVIVSRCSGEGILAAYGRGNTIIQNCVLEENNCGINIHHISGEILVRDNVCKRNGVHKPKYGGIGIFVEGVHHISIQGNACFDNAWAGIVWMGGVDEARHVKYPSEDAVIANNICLRNGSQGGIFINGTYSTTARFLVTGNLCKENARDGIWAFKARDGILANNLCINNNKPMGKSNSLANWQRTASGIRLADCQRVIVTGNRCVDEREEKWQVFGICVEGSSRQNMVAHNIVSGARDKGLLVVEGNTISENLE